MVDDVGDPMLVAVRVARISRGFDFRRDRKNERSSYFYSRQLSVRRSLYALTDGTVTLKSVRIVDSSVNTWAQVGSRVFALLRLTSESAALCAARFLVPLSVER